MFAIVVSGLFFVASVLSLAVGVDLNVTLSLFLIACLLAFCSFLALALEDASEWEEEIRDSLRRNDDRRFR